MGRTRVPWLFKKLLKGRCNENDDVLMSPTLDEDEPYVEKKENVFTGSSRDKFIFCSWTFLLDYSVH